MPKYEELHRQLVDELRKVGIHHGYKDRLPLAVYRQRLEKLVDDGTFANIVRLLDACVTLRTKGLEPAHKDGGYV